MPMIPPLVREPSAAEPRTPGTSRAPFTGHPVDARLARPQRRYASNYNISFVHEPPKPIARPAPEPAPEQPVPEPATAPRPESTFDQWRAVADAERERLGIDAAEAPDAAMPAPAPRQRLHDALLGTTAVVLLGVLGGIVHYAWTHDGPEAAAPGGTASKGSGLSAFMQPLWAMAAKMGPQAAPDRIPAPASGGDVATEIPSPRQAPQPAAPPSLSVASDAPAPATPLADKPALAVPPAPAPGTLTTAAEAVPTPERAAAALFPPAAPAEARPVPEQAAAVASALPARSSEPDAVLPVVTMPPRPAQPAVEQMAAQAVPSAPPLREPDAAPAVPATAAATVRLAPAPEWAQAAAVPLAPPPEAAVLPSAPAAPPAVPASPTPAAEPAAGVSAEMARTILPGVDAQQVMSTMQLVQQMSLLVHDMHGEGLRYRTEVTELTGAVQEKAANLEERLRRAEARTAAGSGPETGWRRAGGASAAASDPGDGGELRAAAAEASRTLRRYHVQAGSADAVVLSDGNAGPEQAARLLVVVGDQVPGVGRVRAIVQRGRSWLVQTDHGEIR